MIYLCFPGTVSTEPILYTNKKILEMTRFLPPPLFLSLVGHLLDQDFIGGPIVPLEEPEGP